MISTYLFYLQIYIYIHTYNTIQNNTTQYNTKTIQYNTIQKQYNTIQYNTIQYNTIHTYVHTYIHTYISIPYNSVSAFVADGCRQESSAGELTCSLLAPCFTGHLCVVICKCKCSKISSICSMYGVFAYIWVIFRANVGKYTIHGAYVSWSKEVWKLNF